MFGAAASQTVFTREHNKLFIQQVGRYSLVAEGDELHYHVLGLDVTSTEDDTKKPIVNWLFDLTLTEISIHNFLMWCK